MNSCARVKYPIATPTNPDNDAVSKEIAQIYVSDVTGKVTEAWHGLFALPETPHYLAMFSWGSTFGVNDAEL